MSKGPDNNIQPVYALDGKRLGTVTGIWNHLRKKHNAFSISGIGFERILYVYGDNHTVIARYAASPCVIGKDVVLTRLDEKVHA